MRMHSLSAGRAKSDSPTSQYESFPGSKLKQIRARQGFLRTDDMRDLGPASHQMAKGHETKRYIPRTKSADKQSPTCYAETRSQTAALANILAVIFPHPQTLPFALDRSPPISPKMPTMWLTDTQSTYRGNIVTDRVEYILTLFVRRDWGRLLFRG